jgi:DNA excision repair protein ERCC-2
METQPAEKATFSIGTAPMKQKLQVGVRDLVGYVLRGGDLRQGFVGSRRAVDGIRGHQRVQRQRPSGYQAEVHLTHTHETDDVRLQISGRLDGLLVDGDNVLIEEIKTTTAPLDRLKAHQDPTHWGQVMVYAYLYAHQEDLRALTLRLTYYQLDTEALLELDRVVDIDDLQVFFSDLLTRYLDWARTVGSWALERDRALVDLGFPYGAYRPGQRHMAICVYRRIRDGGHLMIEAPTGIGKTMGTLFPAAKALGEGCVEKIFYLTARTTGRLTALAAAQALNAHEPCLKTLVLTAKEKICPHADTVCAPEECARAHGHYDRVNAALTALFNEVVVEAELLGDCARRHRVCPFELSLDLALWVDCIICDYNYVFDPRVRLRRFFDENAGRFAFLVDEAHNLVDRAREMYSATLNKKAVLALRREVKHVQPGIYKILGRINTWMLKVGKRCDELGDDYAEEEAPENLYPHLYDFYRRSEVVLAEKKPGADSEGLLEQYFAVHRFLRVIEQYDAAYRTCYRRLGSDVGVELYCLDPARQLGEMLASCRSAVFFSATLTPRDYYRQLLGLSAKTQIVNLVSPFPSDHLAVLVDSRVSTHYRDRLETREAVALRILAMVCGGGNHLVFFPSYAYLEMVHLCLAELAPDLELQVQRPGMAESDREAFLKHFRSNTPDGCVGLVVMGGIFGEGIDLAGERLTGAVIVGVGLPGICLERDLIRDYFTDHGRDGFAYAYTYPGITRVLQAAGRVIRTATDRGTVLLMDRRYGSARYRRLMPPHWQPVTAPSGERLEHYLDCFWQR